MSLVKVNWKPDEKLLKEFSEFWLIFVGMFLAPLAYFGAGPFRHLGGANAKLAAVLWGLALAGRIVGWLRPAWLKGLFVGLTVLALPIGWVVSNLTLMGIYYLVFTPVALVFRLIGRDALERKLDRQAKTYWEEYNPNRGVGRYLRQF